MTYVYLYVSSHEILFASKLFSEQETLERHENSFIIVGIFKTILIIRKTIVVIYFLYE